MNSDENLNSIRGAKEAWENGALKDALTTAGERQTEFRTESGIPVRRLYTPLDLADRAWTYLDRAGFPGEYPFTRGATPTMFRGKIFELGPAAGFGTAEDMNRYYKYLLSQGIASLPLSFQLASHMGYDSDHPMARGDVGRQGVAFDSLQDIETVYKDIPLDGVPVNGAINATAPIYFACMETVLESRDRFPQDFTLTIQNDILKEFTARGTYIFPPGPSVKFSADLIEHAIRNKLDYLRPIAYCGYHIREAGADMFLELAATLANISAYVEEVVSRGIDIDSFPAVQVFLVAGLDFFEEIAKLRAFRRMYARMMRERFRARAPQSLSFTYFCGSQPSQLTAQQPLNNIIRTTVSTLVQVLGGGQIGLIACYDEALGLPSREAATVAIRTQQVLAYETSLGSTIDPLAGSYYVESLTDEIEERATKLFQRIDAMGGAIRAIEEGFIRREIDRSAYEHAKKVWSGEKVRVGENRFQTDEPVRLKPMKHDPSAEERQREKLRKLRKERDNSKVKDSLKDLKEAADAGVNLVPPVKNAVQAYATVGEICDVLRAVYGEWQPTTL